MKPRTAIYLYIYMSCLLCIGNVAAQHYDDAEALGLLPEEQILEPNIRSSSAVSRPAPAAQAPAAQAAVPSALPSSAISPAGAPAAAAPIVNPGYGLQPGDVLQISVWNEETLNLQVLVRPDGGFSYPLAGEIQAQGKSTEQVRTELADKLSKYIPDPEVSVSLIQVAGNKVYVVGKVQRPGEFVMIKDLDVMQALSLAGGTTTFADLNDIKILRRQGGEQVAIPFNYSAVIEGSRLEQNILLQNGDVVVVP